MVQTTRNIEEDIKNLDKRAKERVELLEMRNWKTIDELLDNSIKSRLLYRGKKSNP